MARHGREDTLVCRIADRGNGRVYSDPRDLKIKRLRRRVRDLELQQEIRRLKQQIQDLNVALTWKEMEPEEPVGDELTVDEEHPIHGDFIYHSPPCFDNYEDEEVNNEGYCWTAEALKGVVVQEGELLQEIDILFRSDRGTLNETRSLNGKLLNKEMTEYDKASVGIFNEFFVSMVDKSGRTILKDGYTVVEGGGFAKSGGQNLVDQNCAPLETPTNIFNFTEVLNNVGNSIFSEIQIEDKDVGDSPSKVKGTCDKNRFHLTGGIITPITRVVHGDITDGNFGPTESKQEKNNYIYPSSVESIGDGLMSTKGNKHAHVELNCRTLGFLNGPDKLLHQPISMNGVLGLQNKDCVLYNRPVVVGVHTQTKANVQNTQFGIILVRNLNPGDHFNPRKRRSDVPFDPGGALFKR